MRIRQLNHSVYQGQYHLVWGTKYRRKILKHYVRKELIKSFYKTQKSYPDWYFIKINTDNDHVHILMEIPPKYSVSKVVQELKSRSSKALRKKFPFIKKMSDDNAIWAIGFFMSTVGLNEESIRKYIEKQGNQDKPIDITAELS
jgi:putative transposase